MNILFLSVFEFLGAPAIASPLGHSLDVGGHDAEFYGCCKAVRARRAVPLHLDARLRWKNARNLPDGILGLNDLYRIAGDLQTGAGFRNVFEVFEYQTIQCLCAIQRKVQAQLAIQFAQTAAAFQQKTSVLMAQELSGL